MGHSGRIDTSGEAGAPVGPFRAFLRIVSLLARRYGLAFRGSGTQERSPRDWALAAEYLARTPTDSESSEIRRGRRALDRLEAAGDGREAASQPEFDAWLRGRLQEMPDLLCNALFSCERECSSCGAAETAGLVCSCPGASGAAVALVQARARTCATCGCGRATVLRPPLALAMTFPFQGARAPQVPEGLTVPEGARYVLAGVITCAPAPAGNFYGSVLNLDLAEACGYFPRPEEREEEVAGSSDDEGGDAGGWGSTRGSGAELRRSSIRDAAARRPLPDNPRFVAINAAGAALLEQGPAISEFLAGMRNLGNGSPAVAIYALAEAPDDASGLLSGELSALDSQLRAVMDPGPGEEVREGAEGHRKSRRGDEGEHEERGGGEKSGRHHSRHRGHHRDRGHDHEGNSGGDHHGAEDSPGSPESPDSPDSPRDDGYVEFPVYSCCGHKARWQTVFCAAVLGVAALAVLNLVLISIMLYRVTSHMRMANLTVSHRLLVGDLDPALLDQPAVSVSPLEGRAAPQPIDPGPVESSAATGIITSSLHASAASLADISASQLVYTKPLDIQEALRHASTRMSLGALETSTMNVGATLGVRELHAVVSEATVTDLYIRRDAEAGSLLGGPAAAAAVSLENGTIGSVGSLRQAELEAANLTVVGSGALRLNQTSVTLPDRLAILNITVPPATPQEQPTELPVRILGTGGAVSLEAVLATSFSGVTADTLSIGDLYLGRLLAEVETAEGVEQKAVVESSGGSSSLQVDEAEADSASFTSGSARTLNAQKCKTGA